MYNSSHLYRWNKWSTKNGRCTRRQEARKLVLKNNEMKWTEKFSDFYSLSNSTWLLFCFVLWHTWQCSGFISDFTLRGHVYLCCSVTICGDWGLTQATWRQSICPLSHLLTPIHLIWSFQWFKNMCATFLHIWLLKIPVTLTMWLILKKGWNNFLLFV